MQSKITFCGLFFSAAALVTAIGAVAQETAPAQEASPLLCWNGRPMILGDCEPVPIPNTTPTVERTCPDAPPPRRDSELPAMVCIPYLNVDVGAFEVTFAQWRACVDDPDPDDRCEDVTTPWDDDLKPVANVTWYDAQAYVRWLSRRTGDQYRLLTSDEWTIAARGRSGRLYSWGRAPPVCDRAAFNGANFQDPDDPDCPGAPMDVGSFPHNDFGLYDMHGNVLEWVEDPVDSVGSMRVIRGGSYRNRRDALVLNHSQPLNPRPPAGRLEYVGFRVARDPAQPR